MNKKHCDKCDTVLFEKKYYKIQITEYNVKGSYEQEGSAELCVRCTPKDLRFKRRRK